MIRRNLVLAALLLAGCGSTAGPGKPAYPPHQPGLSLPALAASPDAGPCAFSSYNPRGPSRWNQGWPWKLDLSGIGWDNLRTVTAITPRHVVMADHFQRHPGSPVTFHDRQGKPHTRRILRVLSLRDLGLPCDVAVGLLDQPLPASIRSYPLPEPDPNARDTIRGATVLVTNQERRLHFHRILDFGSNVVHLYYNPEVPDAHHVRLIVGDSGNPSFLLSHGELVLVETHSIGGAGIGPYYGAPDLIAALRKAVAELDPSFTVRTIAADAAVRRDATDGRLMLPSRPQGRDIGPNTPAREQAPPPTRKPRPRTVTPAG